MKRKGHKSEDTLLHLDEGHLAPGSPKAGNLPSEQDTTGFAFRPEQRGSRAKFLVGGQEAASYK